MTNHWVDIGNASLVLVIGANPAENHPACMGHVNNARFDAYGRGRNARLVVVDPRKTRTALQADRYVRIRPGTDIAFLNGMMNYIISGVVAGTGPVDPSFATNFVGWHNGTIAPAVHTTGGRTFVDDGGTTRTLSQAELAGAKYDGVAAPGFTGSRAWPKYCDTRALVSVVGGVADYARTVMTTNSWTSGTNWQFSNMYKFADSILDADTVFRKLEAHVANYTLAETADICGCTQAEIMAVANELVANSRMMSSDFAAAGGSGNGNAAATPGAAGYKAATILYAMGQTQHTNGSQNIRGLAVLQTILGNMGRAGGGINALRGIHNVQGSTDMANLYDGIPGYSGNPGANYVSYSNALFGNRVANGTGTTTTKSAYTPGDLGLQQRGFYNMTTQWFGAPTANSSTARSSADFDKLYGLWPKGNGVQHIEAFRQMISGTIKAAVVWGQNPAVTEPNQSAVRTGLESLDLLVCTDLFENETAACKRKASGVTYLLPACSHVEEAGSVTNSGRWLQWRDRATAPKGNSKADLELLLRLAKKLDAAGAFSHITSTWASMPDVPVTGNAWDVLYGKYCPGWDGLTAGGFEALEFTDTDRGYGTVYGSEAVAENVFKEICRPLDDATVGQGGGGTLWIYSGAGAASGWNTNLTPPAQVGTAAPAYTTVNRAKSRNSAFAGPALTYPRYGWAWLLNRRVFYNNSEVDCDVADVFVAPGVMSRVMTFTYTNLNTLADWSLLYRAYNSVKDVPSVTGGPHAAGLPGAFPAHTEPIETPRRDLAAKYGRNMMFTSTAGASTTNVKTDSKVAMWSSDEAYSDAKYPGTGDWAHDAKDYPLVLTTIRCVEHFQGGPITRNNSWNVEAEPVPWIEINSVDAAKYNIVDGQWVNIITARSNSTSDQSDRTNGDPAWARGFKARVGYGLQSNQRVAAGVVAIPWHWGDKGLSTGSRANDLCLDAFDSNTQIPEYKACLCKIVGL